MSSADPTRRPVVTLAALYGAGGSLIGPRVAGRLGVPFLDREIPEAAARSTGVSEEALATVDEEPRSGLDRLVSSLSRASTPTGAIGGSSEYLELQERSLRASIEEVLARTSVTGGVALGRGGMVVLRTVPWALHVLLGGPVEARVGQAMALLGVDRRTAEHRQAVEDRARLDYVRRAYGIDGLDQHLYHLTLDSTALDIDDCVDLIVAASRARLRHPRPSPAT